MIPITCGTYTQPFWSRTTGVLGAGQVFPAGSPFETQTRMFPMVLPPPRTSISLGTGLACFLAHAGSASIVSGLRLGALPSKVTVPVTVEAATATPGQPDTATSTAASHNLFPVPRMLGSLVITTSSQSACLPPMVDGRVHPV